MLILILVFLGAVAAIYGVILFVQATCAAGVLGTIVKVWLILTVLTAAGFFFWMRREGYNFPICPECNSSSGQTTRINKTLARCRHHGEFTVRRG